MGSLPGSPDPGRPGQRPTSSAPSWMSGGYSVSVNGRAPSSIGSRDSSQGGLHLYHNQYRPQQQHMNVVAEVDGTQPLSELG